MSINITGIYDDGSYRNLDVQEQTVLNGSTAIYGTCTINDVSVMDIITTLISDISDNSADIIILHNDISSNTANIII